MLGDVTGFTSSSVVVALQGYTVASTTPTDTYVLAWNAGASQWEPTPAGGGGSDATSIQGVPVDPTAPTNQYVLTYCG